MQRRQVAFQENCSVSIPSTPSQTTTKITKITVPTIRMAFDPNAVPICIVAVANAVFGYTNEFLDVLVIIPDIYKGRAVPREIS